MFSPDDSRKIPFTFLLQTFFSFLQTTTTKQLRRQVNGANMTKKLPLNERLNRKPISRACKFCHQKHLQCDQGECINNYHLSSMLTYQKDGLVRIVLKEVQLMSVKMWKGKEPSIFQMNNPKVKNQQERGIILHLHLQRHQM